MGATSSYAWPLPDGTSAGDVPYWMGQLGNAIDTQFKDSGWVDVTISGGFAAMAGSEKPQVRRIGQMIYVRGGWLNTGMAINNTYIIGTLPLLLGVSCAPAINDIRALGSSAGNITAQGFIQTGGEFSIRTGPTLGSYYRYDRSYLLG